MQLERVRAIVTGAASGLGRCFATELARHGASVAAVDVNTSGLEELTAQTKDLKGEVVTTQLDVTNETAVVLFINKTSEKFGGVNVLVNNAAILRDGPLAKKEGGWTRKLPTAVWLMNFKNSSKKDGLNRSRASMEMSYSPRCARHLAISPSMDCLTAL